MSATRTSPCTTPGCTSRLYTKDSLFYDAVTNEPHTCGKAVVGLADLAARESARPGNVGQYDTSSVYEPIKVIEHYNLNFSLGCAVKYILRAGKKPGEDPIVELEKARQNIDFEIARLRRLRAGGS